MGFGDEIIASGLARGAAKRNKLIAFGNGKKIIWSDQAKLIFQNNPNVAPPDKENSNNLEWVHYYRGHRGYGEVRNGRWVFNKDWVCPVGELFFSEEEKQFGLKNYAKGWPFVVIEPRVKDMGATAGVNKQWPVDRYAAVAGHLKSLGMRVVQFVPQGRKKIILEVETIETINIRFAISVLKHALLYIGPEGGLHHGAAAVGTHAVVIFGGFNSPKATGYSIHENISVGEPCGNIYPCGHCKTAMESITVDRVIEAATKFIKYPDVIAAV